MDRYMIRKVKSKIARLLAYLALVVALIPLASILLETVLRGAMAINIDFIAERIAPLGQPGGGIGPAIQGTIIVVGIASLIGVPIGVFSGIYLAEFRETKLAVLSRFLSDVLSNMPSIVMGIFGWALIVTVIGWSVIAGAIALAIMMIPVVTRTTEEAIKLVPATIREAALALGVPRWKTTMTVVLSSAKKGVITGILLAIARISERRNAIL